MLKDYGKEKMLLPRFFISEECLGIFEKHIFNYERVKHSVTAQKNTFSSDL